MSRLIWFLGTTRGRLVGGVFLVVVFGLTVGISALVYRSTPKTPATGPRAGTATTPSSSPSTPLVATVSPLPQCPPGVLPVVQCQGYTYPPPYQGGPTPYSGYLPTNCTYSATAARCVPYGSLADGKVITCRLPVTTGQAGGGGFITFPGGTYQADPASNVRLPDTGASPAPQGPGYGYAGGAFSYDRKFSKWLPVDRPLVSPDGASYVFNAAGEIYQVDVATGKAEELSTGFIALDYETAGVYASKTLGGAPQPGLWLISTPSGRAVQLTDRGYFSRATDTAAYGNDAPSYPQGAVNRIIRYDFKSATLSTVLDNSRQYSLIIGFDPNGLPLVTINQALYVLTAPNSLQGLLTGVAIQSLLTDSLGIWIAGSTSNGYQQNTATYLLSDGLLQNMSGVAGIIAGSCR